MNVAETVSWDCLYIALETNSVFSFLLFDCIHCITMTILAIFWVEIIGMSKQCFSRPIYDTFSRNALGKNLLVLYSNDIPSISPGFVGISFGRSIQRDLIRAYTVFLFVQIGTEWIAFPSIARITCRFNSIEHKFTLSSVLYPQWNLRMGTKKCIRKKCFQTRKKYQVA